MAPLQLLPTKYLVFFLHCDSWCVMEKFVKLHRCSVGVLTVTVLLNALPRKAFCPIGR